MSLLVLATAGHVDHGKSTLVRALTGMEPDRWAEERRRGLTIDLGFAWTGLPSGRTAAFVDVPGHQRFIRNALAGFGPVPAALLAVAADGGWMPQSAEHLAVLDALGVQHAVVAITRCDLADPGPALAQARAALDATSLRDAGAVAVSAVTGVGLDALRDALDRMAAALPAPDPAAPVRVWVDRVFIVPGTGTVVTATLTAGTVRTGDALAIGTAGGTAVVRGLHSLGEPAAEVRACARVALALRGVATPDIPRGTPLTTPGAWWPSGTLDVRVHGPDDERAGFGPRTDAVLHLGSAAVPARVRPLGGDIARIALAQALPLHVGDRALLRDPGSRRAVGVTVLDPDPPALARRGSARDRAAVLAAHDGAPDPAAELRCRGLARERDLIALGVRPDAPPVAPGWHADPVWWAARRDELAALARAHHAAHPQSPGLPAGQVSQRLGLPDPRLLEPLVATPGPLLHLAEGHVVAGGPGRLAPGIAAAVAALRADLERDPFTAPDARRLTDVGLRPGARTAAVRAGALIEIADGVVLLPDAPARAAAILAGLPQPFTAGQARQALGTTRRVAVPLLEHLDHAGYTARLPDDTRLSR